MHFMHLGCLSLAAQITDRCAQLPQACSDRVFASRLLLVYACMRVMLFQVLAEGHQRPSPHKLPMYQLRPRARRSMVRPDKRNSKDMLLHVHFRSTCQARNLELGLCGTIFPACRLRASGPAQAKGCARRSKRWTSEFPVRTGGSREKDIEEQLHTHPHTHTSIHTTRTPLFTTSDCSSSNLAALQGRGGSRPHCRMST